MVPVYTTAHQDMTGVLGRHRQTPREGLGREGGGSKGLACLSMSIAALSWLQRR